MSSRVLGILPAFFIAALNWIYAIFVLNRYRGVCAFSKAELIAFLLFYIGGFAAWIAELCILEDGLSALQIIASLYRTFVNWFGFVLIVNERLHVTPQQCGSLAFVLVISVLWDVQHRIVLTN